MREAIKKPGWMGRALLAWFVLNIALAIVFYAFVWLIGYVGISLTVWYVVIPLMIVFVVGEIWIINETIGPVLYKIKEWIFQEESVDRDKGEKPSWEKSDG